MVQRNKAKPSGWNHGQGGFFNDLTANQMKNIQLPDQIKCNRCNKAKQIAAYSNKQLNDARLAISKHGANTHFSLKCNICSGAPISEIKCVECRETKSIDDFMKTHRKDRDNATCKICMEKRLQLDYNVSGDEKDKDSDDDSDISNPYEGDQSTTYGDTQSITHNGSSTANDDESGIYFSSLNGARLSSMNTTGRASSGGVRLPADENEGAGWQSATGTRARRVVSSSIGGNASSVATATYSPATFNKNAYGNPKAPSSVAASAISSSDWGAPQNARPTPTPAVRQFAKVKAYKPEKEKEQETEDKDDISSYVPEGWVSDDEDRELSSDDDDDDDE